MSPRLPAFLARALAALTHGNRRCRACGAVLGSPGQNASGQNAPGRIACGQCASGLCPGCAALLAPRAAGYCPACGLVYPSDTLYPHPCADCLREPRPWDGFAFHGPYEGRRKELVLSFKFGGALGNAALLGQLAREAFAVHGLALPQVVAPVPLHPKRLRGRGFNQSLEIARGLTRLTGVKPDPAALVRVRHTTPQARLPREKRLTNLRGAFAADTARVSGRAVLLVDDVMTTGATLDECALVLRRAGAVRVDVLVLARA